MFDAICKFLVETFSTDFAQWLLGEATSLTELSPSELLLEPIRADVLLLQSDSQVLHLEFQTQPDPTMPFRMLDYWVRLHRRLPEREIRQVVIYLLPSQSSLVKQNTFELANTRHAFHVIRLWEQPAENFLASPGLLPLAVLSKTSNKEATLRQVSTQIEQIRDRRTQSNISTSAAILAGLILKKEIIQQILKKEIMQESVIYQDIWAEAVQKGIEQGRQKGIEQGLQEGLQEGRQEGLQEGRQEGLQEGEIQIVVRLLNRCIGELSAELTERIRDLSLPQIEALAEALLDFKETDELIRWLDKNT